MTARIFDSGFALAHDTYNGMLAASDGCIYYVLCSDRADTAGRMFRCDPRAGSVQQVGDLTQACGESGAIAQGKSHVNFVEAGGKLWFATHTGFYEIIDGMEKMGIPPPGLKPYTGGHLLAYDLESRRFEDFGIPVPGEGILTMNMDPARGRIYGITWPTGRVFYYDVASRKTKDLGCFFEGGENGTGAAYRTICRSLAVDPRDGSVYFTRGEGSILAYRYGRDQVELLDGFEMRKDYFGLYDPASPGHMAYNWRQVVWYAPESVFYGVHGNSGYLFRWDPSGGPGRRDRKADIGAVKAERHVRPVQLRISRLHARPGRRHAALPDWRPHLRRGQTRGRQGCDRKGRVQGRRESPPDHLSHPNRDVSRSRADLLREWRSPGLRQFHRCGGGRNGVHALSRPWGRNPYRPDFV